MVDTNKHSVNEDLLAVKNEPTVVKKEAIECADGYALRYNYLPAKERKAVAVFTSAIGISQKYYHALAQYLCAEGFDCICFDYRGTGEQDAALPKQTGPEQWGVLDIEAVLQKALSFDVPVHVIGHSVGGQVLGLAPSARRLSSVVLVASSAPYWRRMQGLNRWKILLMGHVLVPILARCKTLFPIAAIGLGNIKMPSVFMARWAAWMRQPDYLLAPKFQLDREAYSKIECPILSLGFTDDELAPQQNIQHLADFFSSAKVDVEMISPQSVDLSLIGHNGLFKKRSEKTLWPKVLAALSSASSH